MKTNNKKFRSLFFDGVIMSSDQLEVRYLKRQIDRKAKELREETIIELLSRNIER